MWCKETSMPHMKTPNGWRKRAYKTEAVICQVRFSASPMYVHVLSLSLSLSLSFNMHTTHVHTAQTQTQTQTDRQTHVLTHPH